MAGPADAPTVRWEPAAAPDQDARTLGALRQYSDGVFVSADGDEVRAGANAVALPYAKSDVRFRVASYDILGELGRGGMGVVYRAYSLKLCRFVALKMMTAGRFASEAETARFQNEAMLAARLEHPASVPVYDAGEYDGHLFFVMAFVPGHGFGTLIDSQVKAPPPEREAILRAGVQALATVARALDYAHERGIVHRDIKPDNVILDADGAPHVTDFGIAKNVQREVSLTKPGAIIGTPQYMAPEQANNMADRVGPAADVYSLGATLYHLATGARPFDGDSPIATLIAVLHKLPEDPRSRAKKVLGRALDADLDLIIQKAMEKRAADRYASAGALADDLDAWLEDRPVKARPIGALERAKKAVRRNRAAFAMMVVAVLTLVTLAVGFGTVLAFNLGRTSDSLRAQDEKAARDQAATLERAITANMVEGRADVVRNLVAKLRTMPEVSLIEVVRVDKTLAYTDGDTRAAVEKRLAEPDAQARATTLGLGPKVAMVQSVAFANIDRAAVAEAPGFAVDDATWREALASGKEVTRLEDVGGVPHLTVLKPIPNGEACQVCHGAVKEGGGDNPYAAMYGNADPDNRTRAVLVVRRSQAALEAQIAENSRDTLLVGLGTTVGLLALLWLLSRGFGVRLRPQRFG